MKKVFNSSEIVHIWAKQSQEEGRTPNKSIFFDKKLIYSYGFHFCMANIIEPGTVFITNRNYSVTTSGHLSALRYAVNHMERVLVPFPEKGLDSNAPAWINLIKSELAIIGNTRKKPQTKENAQYALKVIAQNIDRYIEISGQSMSKKWVIDDDIRKEFVLHYNAAKSNQGSEELAEKLNKLAIATKKKEAAKAKELIKKWLSGELPHIYYSGDKVYLRATDKLIQTSKGASVSLKEGKLLYKMIEAGKDVKGHTIDGYTVISLNGVLTIGCHKIEREEITRFAKLQGWK